MIRTVVVSDFAPTAILQAVSPELLEQMLVDVMSGARAFWIMEAQKRLSSSRRDYINGIQEVVTESGAASVALVGAFPVAVEEGMPAYDMRTTLLAAGAKGVHTNAEGGRYRSIPFQHQTPGSSGQGGAAPMGSAYADSLGLEAARAIGKAVYAEAKKLAPTTGMPGGPVSYGGRLPAGLAPKLKGIHTTDIYAGMVRQQKTYAKATQNTYTTFRTISTNSDPAKWMHPGIPAARISEDVEKYVADAAVASLSALIGGAT
jgi:hypothetical protein